MTKEQILALITGKIAGQGSQVDTGGALPAILEGIIELIPEPTPPTPPTPSEILAAITVTSSKNYSNVSTVGALNKGAACEALGISSADLDALMAGNILLIKFTDRIGTFICKNGQIVKFTVGTGDESQGVSLQGLEISYDSNEGTYDIDLF